MCESLKQEHTELLSKFCLIKDKLLSGDKFATFELSQFLNEDIKKHIENEKFLEKLNDL
jgi:hypothetical protein